MHQSYILCIYRVHVQMHVQNVRVTWQIHILHCLLNKQKTRGSCALHFSHLCAVWRLCGYMFYAYVCKNIFFKTVKSNFKEVFDFAICVWLYVVWVYIYAFSRRFYPKQLTIAFGLYIFISMCVPWELNPQPFALLMQCSNHWATQEHNV